MALPAGYGMAGDLRSLGASCPELAHVEKQLRGSLDLLQVHRQVSSRGTGSGIGTLLSLLSRQHSDAPCQPGVFTKDWLMSMGQDVLIASEHLWVAQVTRTPPGRECHRVSPHFPQNQPCFGSL